MPRNSELSGDTHQIAGPNVLAISNPRNSAPRQAETDDIRLMGVSRSADGKNATGLMAICKRQRDGSILRHRLNGSRKRLLMVSNESTEKHGGLGLSVRLLVLFLSYEFNSEGMDLGL